MQDCCVQVVNVNAILHRAETELVALADRDALFQPATGHPHSETVGMMVAAVGSFTGPCQETTVREGRFAWLGTVQRTAHACCGLDLLLY